jgi:hypothetical protein
MAMEPITEQLQANLGNHANVLRVSIHTELGKRLGERYAFETTPLFILFDGQGNEKWRGHSVPSADEVLRAG